MMWLPIIILLVYVYYTTSNKNSGDFSIKAKTPEEILKERYVKGELDEATYLKMKDNIK